MARPLAALTALFDGYSTDVALAEIARAGLSLVEPAYIAGYVDFDEDVFSPSAAARLSGSMSAAALSAIAVSAHHDMGADGAAAATIRRLRFAAGIGARYLITNATTTDRRDAWLRNLDEVLPVCAETGIVIGLENPGHGADALIPDGARGAALVRSLASDHLRINYDFANVFTYSDERVRPEDDLEAILPYVINGHLKDVRSDRSGWSFTALGDGVIDYGAILGRLAAVAPAMPLSFELPLGLRRPGRAAPIRASEPLPLPTLRAALARSVAFMQDADTAWGGSTAYRER